MDEEDKKSQDEERAEDAGERNDGEGMAPEASDDSIVDGAQTGSSGDEEDVPEGQTVGDAIAHELLPVSVETEMRRSYLDYAMSVIVGRALPDVRDGLKPVHRRVLYAMKEIGNTWSSPTKKAARVVGEVLGKYHPHGDSAVYQTIVRMAQDFSLRYPLIFGQGNFGSIDGDGAAAMRYTEVRLQKIAGAMLADINEDTVDFVPNFDNSEQEPVVLPTRLPELLVNGSAGIAVGMATNIPPHNLRETVAACLYCLDNPDCSIDSLIERMPAPDFPTGGIIFGLKNVHQGYRTGRGRVLMRARTHLEEFGKGRTRIVVDEIPYMVNKRVLYERMHELWRDKKLEGISEMRDESSKKIRIAIDLRQGALPEVVLNNLFKNTQLQESFGMNMVALVDGHPMVLNLKQMIESFLMHRREVVTRRTVFRLKKSREAGLLLEGQAIALANIDEFIRLIRESRTAEEATAALMSRGWPTGFAAEIAARAAAARDLVYPEGTLSTKCVQPDGLYWLTSEQVANILAMNLRRLTGLEQEKILGDYRQTMDCIFDYIDILKRPERVNKIIGDELKEVSEQFGDERRSTIDPNGDPNFNKRDLIPRRDMVVTLSVGGYVKSQELADYNAQARGGKGRNVQTMTKDDTIADVFIANSHDIILCFSSKGTVYPIDVFDLPEGKANTRGRPIVNLLPLEEGEQIDFILPIQDFDGERYLVMATNTGGVKRTALSVFRNVRNKGIRAIVLDEGEHLVGVSIAKQGDHYVLFSAKGRAVRAEIDKLRPRGRASGVMRGIRLLDEDNSCAALVVIGSEDFDKEILTATASGYGKRTAAAEYPVKGRGTQGVISIRVDEDTGPVIGAVLVDAADDVMMLSTGGKVIRTRASEVRLTKTRSSRGVRLIRMDDDVLQSIRVVPHTEGETYDELEKNDDFVEDDVPELDDDVDETADDAEDVEEVGAPDGAVEADGR